MSIMVTGAAGFIGSYTARALLARGEEVIGLDNLNDYYPLSLKQARLKLFDGEARFHFHKLDIADVDAMRALFDQYDITAIVHLAAQAGVRYSIENPFAYCHSNLVGHLAVLEAARHAKITHLVYASSSSVYGANEKTPFAEDDKTESPVSLYGATKKSDELLSESYARLYELPLTGLRFFTVYGPWGRPDMAYWIFTEKMLKGEPIRIFNHGKMARDFTYIDDIVEGVLAALDRPPDGQRHFHRVYNLGNDRPEELMSLVGALEDALGVKAKTEMTGMQDGDVERTWADISRARSELGYAPKVALSEGINRFVDWRRAQAGEFS